VPRSTTKRDEVTTVRESNRPQKATDQRARGLRTALGAIAALMALVFGSPSHAQPSQPLARDVLPIPAAPFAGRVELNASSSVPDWPRRVKAPAGAPNVLLIMTDDMGFGSSSVFGGPVPTPALEQLASDGLRYNNFHTTAMCSATRAALLTGRNHHAVSSGAITDMAIGFPGYNSVIPKSAATIAEVLKDNGYNTAMFGKHHNIPSWEATPTGPFDNWPIGLGFEYFYGFIIGDTNQWYPRLYRNNLSADTPPFGDVTLDHMLADDAIHWIHQQKASEPDKPFFAYFATGTGHAPHQAPRAWIERFKGRFDKGWDALREETFARQKAQGIIPADAVLTPRPAELPAWSSLSPTQQRLYARYMEVFAGMAAYQDAQIGRLLGELKRMGQLDNTLVIMIHGDNGASAEGSPTGTLNEVGHFNNDLRRSPEDEARHIDEMGGPKSYPLYPAAWAWALDTPFQWTKQIASHLGGIRNGLIIRWPGHTKDSGTLRTQFAHVTDIMPTVLEAAGVPVPQMVNGAKQQPIDGKSLEYAFENARAAEPPRTQYFEMLGNRAIYKDGWLANTVPARVPWEFGAASKDTYGDYKWQLYDLRHDYSQSHDLAAQHPDKLKELQELFLAEARRNQVLPMDDRLDLARASAAGQHYDTPHTHFEYWGKQLSVNKEVAPKFTARSFSVEAELKLPSDLVTGPILARGSWFGGWGFYLKDGKPTALVVRSEWAQDQFKIVADKALPAGPATVRFDFTYDGGGPLKGGMMCITVNGARAGCGRVATTPSADAGQGETLDIGQDTGAPVTDDYSQTAIFPGDILKVTVDTAPPAQVGNADRIEREASRVLKVRGD
jgi:arylsulfatase